MLGGATFSKLLLSVRQYIVDYTSACHIYRRLGFPCIAAAVAHVCCRRGLLNFKNHILPRMNQILRRTDVVSTFVEECIHIATNLLILPYLPFCTDAASDCD